MARKTAAGLQYHAGVDLDQLQRPPAACRLHLGSGLEVARHRLPRLLLWRRGDVGWAGPSRDEAPDRAQPLGQGHRDARQELPRRRPPLLRRQRLRPAAAAARRPRAVGLTHLHRGLTRRRNQRQAHQPAGGAGAVRSGRQGGLRAHWVEAFHDVTRAAELWKYDAIIVENACPEVASKWVMFDHWVKGITEVLGYNVQYVSVSSAHVGGENNPHAPQWRDRLYLVFTKLGIPLPDVDPRPFARCFKCDMDVNAVQSSKKQGVRRIGKYRRPVRLRVPAQRVPPRPGGALRPACRRRDRLERPRHPDQDAQTAQAGRPAPGAQDAGPHRSRAAAVRPAHHRDGRGQRLRAPRQGWTADLAGLRLPNSYPDHRLHPGGGDPADDDLGQPRRR